MNAWGREVLSTKDVITRLDKLIELGEAMQSSKVAAIEKELSSLHDWRIERRTKAEDTSTAMTWMWRLGPMVIAMVFMFAEFKYLTK